MSNPTSENRSETLSREADETEPSPSVQAPRAESLRSDRLEEPKSSRTRAEWLLVAAGLSSVLAVLAIIISLVALGSTGSNVATAGAPAPATGYSKATGAAQSATPTQTVKLLIKSGAEHGRWGANGRWDVAYLPADFSVHAGDKVTVTVYNYDNGPHTFTSPSLGVNQMIPAGGGSLSAPPSRVTFTFTAPTKPGRYAWWCTIPCNPYSMSHNGFMRGYVTVQA